MSNLKSQARSQISNPTRNFAVFLSFLLILDFFWLLGTKISDILLDQLLRELEGNLDANFARIQSLDSIYNFVVAGAVIIWGILVDRFPTKRRIMLVFNNGLWILINFIFYYSAITIPMYTLAQVCWGITIGANGPIIYSYLGDLYEIRSRGRLFSIFATGLYLIKGSSSALTGILGQVFLNWKLPNLIMAYGSIIVLVSYFLWIREPKLAQIEPEFKEKIAQGQQYKYHLEKASIKTIIHQRTNFLFLIQGFFGMIGVTIVNRYIFYWFTSTYKDGMGMSATLTTILLAISAGFGAIIGINFAGWWADRQFRQGKLNRMLHFSILCLFGEVVGYTLLIFIPQYPTSILNNITDLSTLLTQFPVFWTFIFIFNFCMLFGTGIGPVVGMTRTHLNLPEHRATVSALYDTTDFIGAGAGLLLGNIFSSITDSLRIPIFIGALFWIVSGIIWLFITKYINQDYANIRKIMQDRTTGL